jgi:hypothetical protein
MYEGRENLVTNFCLIMMNNQRGTSFVFLSFISAADRSGETGWVGRTQIGGRLAIMYVDWCTEFGAAMTVMYRALPYLYVVALAWSMDCFSTFRFEVTLLFSQSAVGVHWQVSSASGLLKYL